MSQSTSSWEQTYSSLFSASVEKYRAGHQKASGLVSSGDKEFLASIGSTEQEFFDFVEDFARGGEPTLEMVLAITTVRRDYFLQEQKGIASDRLVDMGKLPAKDAQVGGIVWLPRILQKAEAKLRGEMPPELMYGCGGDRRFFKNHQVAPAELLRQVWAARGDHSGVIAWVKAQA